MKKDSRAVVVELLKKRGIVEEVDIQEFLSEKPTKTYDPFLLLNLEAGVDLILSAIKNKMKICIYGDYDADGITSTAILLEMLSSLTDNLEYYIPSRFDEGYGLNKEALYKIKNRGVQLIITVDCGSVSCDEVDLAIALGMEILVTDHHNIGEKKPNCLIINPKQSACEYPFKELAGCGVAFKLCQGLQKKAGLPKALLSELLDLVGIGTIGDIVPLIDENRTLAKYGTKAINKTKRHGLVKLIQEIGLKYGEVTSENIAYAIVPHINSAGRMAKPETALLLLISKEEEVQKDSLFSLISSNRLRRKLQEESFLECVSIVETSLLNHNFKVIMAENTHEGIAGIVAGKIKDRYERPAIVITRSGEYLKGTGRSIKTIDLYEILKGAEGAFEKFGGHAGACGFLMKKEKLTSLIEYLEAETNRQYSNNPSIFSVEQEIDYILNGGEISISLAKELKKMAPFGHSNEKPFFQLEEVLVKEFSHMGAAGNHLRLTCICKDGTILPCVLFNEANKYANLLNSLVKVSIYGYLDTNSWNGKEKIQFVVQLIKC